MVILWLIRTIKSLLFSCISIQRKMLVVFKCMLMVLKWVCSLPISLTKNAKVLKNVLLPVHLDWLWSWSALLAKWKCRFVLKLTVTPWLDHTVMPFEKEAKLGVKRIFFPAFLQTRGYGFLKWRCNSNVVLLKKLCQEQMSANGTFLRLILMLRWSI